MSIRRASCRTHTR